MLGFLFVCYWILFYLTKRSAGNRFTGLSMQLIRLSKWRASVQYAKVMYNIYNIYVMRFSRVLYVEIK